MHDLIIVGAGPAGLTAGLYAGRYRLKALILEKAAVGGQIVMSGNIENFPGFPGGIATQDLIQRMEKQVQDLEVPVNSEEVKEISSADNIYRLRTDENSYEAKAIIIASGAQSKRLGVLGEDKFIGKGVSYCATCDAPLFRNKNVTVVGGGDRAMEEAIFLTRYASQVNLIHRREEFRASAILSEELRRNPKINLILNSVVREIIGKDKVEAVKIKDVKTGAFVDLPCEGVFIFVGIQPNTSFVKNLLKLDEAGFIITDQDLRASLAGVFACGDCRGKNLYQVINACGEAAVAAYSAYAYLLTK